MWAEVANAPAQIDRVSWGGYNERSIARVGIANVERVSGTGIKIC